MTKLSQAPDPILSLIHAHDQERAHEQHDEHTGIRLSSPNLADQTVIGDDLAGVRLDVAMSKTWEVLSRRKAMQMIEDDLVLVNGRKARKGHRLEVGDAIMLAVPPVASNFSPIPNAQLALDVLYEDAHVLVLNKPAGMPTCPLRRDEETTLVNAMIARYPETLLFGYRLREPGVLHRLDNDTSGAVLVARSAEVFERLRIMLESHEIEKCYTALARGHVTAPQTIDAPIRPCAENPRKVLVGEGKGTRDATSIVTRADRFATTTAKPLALSLVSVSANHATRHQVRAHLAHIGHPLAGDVTYGGPVLPTLQRHFLHASLIAFNHPVAGTRIAVRAPLPDDLRHVLDTLRAV